MTTTARKFDVGKVREALASPPAEPGVGAVDDVGRGEHILTHSRLACFRTCPRKHQLRYEHGLVPDRPSRALRFGTAYHTGLQVLNETGDPSKAYVAIDKLYKDVPAWALIEDWRLEQTRVKCMVSGWFWRYGAVRREVVAAELHFEIPLRNPKTGAESKLFRLAGKIDAIVKLEDGRLAVEEYKTTGDDVSAESDYWRRLRLDQQIGVYILAARELGYDCATVLYDVTRKPSIAPKKLTKAQQKLHNTERETLTMHAERLMTDIGERPDFYYARREIPRLEADLDELRLELWQQQTTLRAMQRSGGWYRNTGACNAPFPCAYLPVCSDRVDPAGPPPRGYVRLTTSIHPELDPTPTPETED